MATKLFPPNASRVELNTSNKVNSRIYEQTEERVSKYVPTPNTLHDILSFLTFSKKLINISIKLTVSSQRYSRELSLKQVIINSNLLNNPAIKIY